MKAKERNDIISSYGTTLLENPMSIKPEKALPYPKDIIRRAIIEELLYVTDSKSRDVLEVGFATLEDFLPEEEFKVVEPFMEPYQKFLMSHQDLEKNRAIGGQQLVMEMKRVGFEIIWNVNKKLTERFSKRVDQLKVLREMLGEL